jgi:MinD-like ATPase involved in chromosome partitioning or flagellar assembly
VYIITFYSFKGGVGRTMALVNTAAELALRGRKVLLVDFDLEAPGLTTYELLRAPEAHPGIVEYVTEFRRTRRSPLVTDFLYEARLVGEKGGRLWVMPAGRGDAEYRRMLNALNWRTLYQQEEGFLLFEDTRLQWDAELHPDYVLIDARTGHTDIEGICTRQLADAVVVVFYPNEQNLAGLREVCHHIRAEETSGLKKKIQLHFVASNVPDLDDEKGILRRHMRAFREGLGFRELSGKIKRYESLHLLDQSVFTLDHPRSKLALSYQRLLRTLLKGNLEDRDGALFFLQDYPKRHETRVSGELGVFAGEFPLPPLTAEPPASSPPAPDVRPTVSFRNLPVDLPENKARGHLMVHLSDGREGACIAFWKDMYSLHRIGHSFKDDAEILDKVAECFLWEEDYGSAVRLLNRVLQLEPNRTKSFWLRARCKTNLPDLDGAAEDLLACLRLPGPLDDPYPKYPFFKQNCLTKLRDIAPSKLFEVADLLETEGLPGVNPGMVASFLCDTEEGTSRAVRLLHATNESVPVGILLLARRWKEVIELYEAGGLKEEGASGLLRLALAHWGEDGELPESLCRRALEALESDDHFIGHWGLETVGLLLWRVGQVTDALECLEKAEEKARAATDHSFSTEAEDEVLSLWRLRKVSIGQYLDDCRLLRRMFQGEPIRPAFLGPPR